MTAEQRVPVASLGASWLTMSFVHWRVDPSEVQVLLPDGLTVDEYDGAAWVGLTPFVMADMSPLAAPGVPGLARTFGALPGLGGRVPDLSTTPETNLRTYVRGPGGEDGLWFLTMDIGNPALAAALRSSIGAPYNTARLGVERVGDVVRYTGSRVGGDESYDLTVRPEAGVATDPLSVWLTGRWRAYTRRLGRLLVTPVEHEPWPLRDAHVVDLRENLTGSVGLPPLGAPHVVHFSEGVRRVRLGVPRVVGSVSR